MLKKWLVLGIAALLLVATGIVAVVHMSNQETVECMVILHKDQKTQVSFEDLDQGTFAGELINGKGDVTHHEYTGILLKDLLKSKGVDLTGITGVTVTSGDNYSVEFTAEELLQENKVYIAITADGAKIEGIDPGTDGVQVIVFGDENSRRCVRFAQKIQIQ